MAITYASAGGGVSTETTGAALSPLCPAVVAAGQILLAHVYAEGILDSPSTPNGWTLLSGPHVIQTTVARHWVFGRVADGTEDGAAVAFGAWVSVNQRAARIYSFNGRVSGAIGDCVLGFAATSHSTDPQMPTVTTTVAGSLAAAFVAQNDNNALAAATGESGGDWVEAVAEYVAALTPGLVLQLQTAAMASVGTISGGAVAATNDPSGVIGFEIRDSVPAVTGTGAVAAQDATASGSGVSLSTGTGTPAAQSSAASGAGVSLSTGTGAPASQASSAAGEGAVEDGEIAGEGAPASQASAASGAGITESAGLGAPAAQSSQAGGVGVSLSTGLLTDVLSGLGALSGSGAVSGEGAVGDGYAPPYVGSGSVQRGWRSRSRAYIGRSSPTDAAVAAMAANAVIHGSGAVSENGRTRTRRMFRL